MAVKNEISTLHKARVDALCPRCSHCIGYVTYEFDEDTPGPDDKELAGMYRAASGWKPYKPIGACERGVCWDGPTRIHPWQCQNCKLDLVEKLPFGVRFSSLLEDNGASAAVLQKLLPKNYSCGETVGLARSGYPDDSEFSI